MTARATRPGPFVATVALAATALALILMLGRSPAPASAAPCPTPTTSFTNGVLSISGTSPCSFDPEGFSVFCAATVRFDYSVNATPQGSVDTGVACGAPTSISVSGGYGADEIDLTRVTRAAGFTGISQPNMLDGGPDGDLLKPGPLSSTDLGGSGNDILLIRNGAPDTADCGDGVDAVQADQPSLDTVSAATCELRDVLPEPAANKKCKKHRRHRKCKKRTAAARRA